MNTPGNDDAGSDGGSPEQVPGLPPDWGRVIVPDDASALAAEAALVRRELRQQARRRPGPPGGRPRPAAWLPLLALLVAALVTLASLLAVTWPHQRPGGPRTAAGGATPTGRTGADPTGDSVPALDLVDENQRPVALRALLPAVIVLVDGCACDTHTQKAVRLAPPGVSVLAVTNSVRSGNQLQPVLTPTGAAPRTLADPTGGLRRFLRLDTSAGRPVTVLVARSGRVVRVLPDPSVLAGHQAELSSLPVS